MQFVNRNPQYPGRVKLVPVSGSSELYDMTIADGSVSGSYTAGTPLDADTLNGMLDEINTAISNNSGGKINTIKITDGTNNGTTLTVGSSKDLTLRLPSTINATLTGTADAAKSITSSYGSVTMKTVSLGTSYTTVYSGKTYSTIIIIIAPWSGSAQNTAAFAASYANGSTSINDLTYVNKNGYIKKQWSGSSFQVSLSSANAAGVYSITIIDAHY